MPLGAGGKKREPRVFVKRVRKSRGLFQDHDSGNIKSFYGLEFKKMNFVVAVINLGKSKFIGFVIVQPVAYCLYD